MLRCPQRGARPRTALHPCARCRGNPTPPRLHPWRLFPTHTLPLFGGGQWGGGWERGRETACEPTSARARSGSAGLL